MSLNIKTATGRQVLASNGDVLVGGSDYEVYSENETMVGYYCGKPLYRKVFKLGAISNWSANVWKTLVTVVEPIEPIYGVFKEGNWAPYPIAVTSNSNSINCMHFKNANLGSSSSNSLIIEYLKVNDSAVADTNTYSTVEKLTGETWIDGKPIYRKIVQAVTPSVANELVNILDSSHLPSNVEQVVKIDGVIYIGLSNLSINCTNGLSSANRTAYTIWSIESGIRQLVSVDEMANKNEHIILEYTKTTD